MVEDNEEPGRQEYGCRNRQDSQNRSGICRRLEGEESSLIHDYKVSIRLVREGTARSNPVEILSPSDVYDFLRKLESYDREVFYCLHLSSKHHLLSCEEVSKGSLNASIVHPREVYKAAILHSAAAIIIAHNHPSGDPEPSSEDLSLTERLRNAGEIIGIQVLDHVIVGYNCYYSMAEEGQLPS